MPETDLVEQLAERELELEREREEKARAIEECDGRLAAIERRAAEAARRLAAAEHLLSEAAAAHDAERTAAARREERFRAAAARIGSIDPEPGAGPEDRDEAERGGSGPRSRP